MKKLLGVIALLITATLLLAGFETYSHREERAELESMQDRVYATRANLDEHKAAMNAMHTALMQRDETIRRDSVQLDAFEAKHRGGISDYKVYRSYKERVADWNASVKQYNAMQAEWDSLDKTYAADARAYDLLVDSTRSASVQISETSQVLPRFASLKAALARL